MTIFFKLPPNSGRLSITDKFLKTRRCPLLRGFTVICLLCFQEVDLQNLVLTEIRNWLIDFKETINIYSKCLMKCNAREKKNPQQRTPQTMQNNVLKQRIKQIACLYDADDAHVYGLKIRPQLRSTIQKKIIYLR